VDAASGGDLRALRARAQGFVMLARPDL
jgi:hypothetical protein